jgi:hypothetical protein
MCPLINEVRPMRRFPAWGRRLESWSGPSLFCTIFLTAVIVRMSLSLWLGTYQDLTRYEMERTAIAFAHTGTLANPYNIPTGPTAHVSPGYPVLMGLIFRYVGEGWAGEIVKELLSVSAAAALYALFPFAAVAFGIGRRAGLLAGIAGALFPLKYQTEVNGDWEATTAALALLLMAYVTAKTWRNRNFTLRRGAWEGLGWGVTLLFASALFSVFCGLLLAGFAALGRHRPKAYLAYAAASLGIAALCLAPWAWRNQRQLGSPIFLRSNTGIELRISNNDMAGPSEPENYLRGVYFRYHPLQNPAEAEAVRRMGEPAYNRDRLRQALAWMRSHPQRFAGLTALRFLYTWFPHTTAHKRDLVLDAFTLASIAGFVLLFRADRFAALLLAVLPLTYTPLFYLVHVNVRHRYPIDWVVSLTACYFAVCVAERLFAPEKLGKEVAQHAA